MVEYDTLTEKTVMFRCVANEPKAGYGGAAIGSGTGNYRSRAPDRMRHQIKCCPISVALDPSSDNPHANCSEPIGVPQCAVPRSAEHFSVAIQGIVSPYIHERTEKKMGLPIADATAKCQELGTIVDDGDHGRCPDAVYLHLAHKPPKRPARTTGVPLYGGGGLGLPPRGVSYVQHYRDHHGLGGAGLGGGGAGLSVPVVEEEGEREEGEY
jgi:hypothetical protein